MMSGAFGAVGALSYGLFAMWKADAKKSQYAVSWNLQFPIQIS